MKLIEIYFKFATESCPKPIQNYATEIEIKNGFLICTDVDDNIHAYNLDMIGSYHIILKAPQNCQ